MGFMKPEIFEGDYWEVETTAGTEIVPFVVESDETKLGLYLEGKADARVPPTRGHGWLARMQAPGFLDATAWAAFESEEKAKAYLAALLGEESRGGNDEVER